MQASSEIKRVMQSVKKLSLTALSAIAGFGPRSIIQLQKTLKKHAINWNQFWASKARLYAELNLPEILIEGIKNFKKEYTIYSYTEMLQLREIRPIDVGEAEYPPLLAQSELPPPILFAKGSNFDWQAPAVVAVVGTRNMTTYGRLVTEKLVSELTNLGVIIVSGFMYGVDLTAHQACVKLDGKTVGVLGYGFDYCYPNYLKPTLAELQAKGMLFLSPFAPHLAPKKGLFPARNRVVAAMADAVLVTEAGQKSGSHITAGFAADEGRLVCAVPGPITNPYSEGTKALLNQGACLVSSGMEVLAELGACFTQTHSQQQQSSQLSLGVFPAKIFEVLRAGPATVEELARQLVVEYRAVQPELTKLELSGKVTKEANRWQLTGFVR